MYRPGMAGNSRSGREYGGRTLERIVVVGGKKLEGTVNVEGAKNAVLPIIAATLLGRGTTQLGEVPFLADVTSLCSMLQGLGASVERRGKKISINTNLVNTTEATSNNAGEMRASFLLMGPLLARFREARMLLPGGCAIGSRPVDLHLKGFAALGAEVQLEHGSIEARAERLVGARIYLDFPSVGATENLMMAASLAEGQTILENVAEEPEIVDLANFLNNMGARVSGAGTNIIKVTGVEELRGCNHVVIPDRIEAGTYMAAAAATGGDVFVGNVIIDHLKPVVAKLREAGVEVWEESDGVRVRSSAPLKAVDIKTMPYPGFPTDMQAQMMALLARAEGTSVISETVFENRFMHVDELKKMGAQITTEGHTAILKGTGRITGAAVKATDLRAGAALVIAGLSAEGVTEVREIKHIKRGYDGLVEKLSALGADIRVVETGDDRAGEEIA